MEIISKQEILNFEIKENFKDAKKEKYSYSPSEFIKNFTHNNVHVDPSIQTQERWEKGDYESFIHTVETDTCDDKIIVCDLSSCYMKAIKDNNEDDRRYFLELINRGFKYVSLDGNHRTQLMWQHSSEMNKYKYQNIEVVVYMFLSVKEMHAYARRKNLQKSWNNNELRNVIVSPVRNFVAKISDEYIDTTNKIRIKTDRRQNHEYVAKLLYTILCKYQKTQYGVDQKKLTNLYYVPISSDFFDRFESVMKMWSYIINVKIPKPRQIRKMFPVTLFMMCDSVLTTNPELINKEYLEHIGNKFIDIAKKIEKENRERYYIECSWSKYFDLHERNAYVDIDERVEYFLNQIYTNE